MNAIAPFKTWAFDPMVKHKTQIQWTHIPGYIGATWNPLIGCEVYSPGCIHCYAMILAATRLKHMARYAGTTTMTKAGPVWNGEVVEGPDSEWMKPLTWRKPHAIFVEDMSDLFYKGYSDAQIDRAFAIMALCPQHIFMVLTKRSTRMRHYISDCRVPSAFGSPDVCIRVVNQCEKFGVEVTPQQVRGRWPLPNVWLGVSTEDQPRADERIPDLLASPAAKRFISAEPLLGPIDLRHVAPTETGYINALSSTTGPNLDWVITGGESGSKARAHGVHWDRAIQGQCSEANVAYFRKQAGANPFETDAEYVDGRPVGESSRSIVLANRHGADMSEWPVADRVREFPILREAA